MEHVQKHWGKYVLLLVAIFVIGYFTNWFGFGKKAPATATTTATK